MIVATFIIYLFISSAILIYGIGLKSLVVLSEKPKHVCIFFAKNILTTVLSIVIMWPITIYYLVPFGLYDIFPFFCVLIVILISTPLQKLFQKFFNIDVSEFAITFCVTLLAINEAISLPNALLIATVSLLTFYILLPLLFTIRKRIAYSNPYPILKKGAFVFLIITVILIALLSINISWLSFEVL